MTLQPLPSGYHYIKGKFGFRFYLFYQCTKNVFTYGLQVEKVLSKLLLGGLLGIGWIFCDVGFFFDWGHFLSLIML
jgi:hypothetical protein